MALFVSLYGIVNCNYKNVLWTNWIVLHINWTVMLTDWTVLVNESLALSAIVHFTAAF